MSTNQPNENTSNVPPMNNEPDKPPSPNRSFSSATTSSDFDYGTAIVLPAYLRFCNKICFRRIEYLIGSIEILAVLDFPAFSRFGVN
jgi:hypothetical protein